MTFKIGLGIGEIVPTAIKGGFVTNARGSEKILKVVFRGTKIKNEDLMEWSKTGAVQLGQQIKSAEKYFIIIDLIDVNIVEDGAEDALGQLQSVLYSRGKPAASFIYSAKPNIVTQFRRVAAKGGVAGDTRQVTYISQQAADHHGAKLQDVLLKASLSWFYDHQVTSFSFS
jgi:hypothetical protein